MRLKPSTITKMKATPIALTKSLQEFPWKINWKDKEIYLFPQGKDS